MKILDFQRHTVTIRDKPGILFRSTIVFLDPPKRMHVTFAGYSYIPIGISLYSIFIWEYSPENSWATFAEYSGIYHGSVPRILHKHIFARWVNVSINDYSFKYICLVRDANS